MRLFEAFLAGSRAKAVEFHDCDWEMYKEVDRVREERGSRAKLIYDNGRLTFVASSNIHEWLSNLIGRIVEDLSIELNVVIFAHGAATMEREDLDPAMGFDDSYFVRPAMPLELPDPHDTATALVPDLGIEVEVSRTIHESPLRRAGNWGCARRGASVRGRYGSWSWKNPATSSGRRASPSPASGPNTPAAS